MLWSDWIDALGLAFDTSSQDAGIIVGFILILTVSLFVIVAMRQHATKPMFVIDLILIIGLVFAGWFPAFAGTIMAFIVAVLLASIIRSESTR
jgi:hypothetical protein